MEKSSFFLFFQFLTLSNKLLLALQFEPNPFIQKSFLLDSYSIILRYFPKPTPSDLLLILLRPVWLYPFLVTCSEPAESVSSNIKLNKQCYCGN